MLGPDGRFEFQGLSAGDYEMSAAVRGYELPAKVRPKNEDFSDREAYLKAADEYYTAARGVVKLSLDGDREFEFTLQRAPNRR